MKKGSFLCPPTAQKAFETIKQRLCEALVLALPNFEELFEVEFGASGVGIRVFLTQLRKPLALGVTRVIISSLRPLYSTLIITP